MKKIINGKTYNTETAEYLESYTHSTPRNFNYYYEEFYRTKKGTFFLYGEGNAASPYAEHCSYGGSDPGTGFKILTEIEAKEWTERHLSAAEYCEIFGEPEEG